MTRARPRRRSGPWFGQMYMVFGFLWPWTHLTYLGLQVPMNHSNGSTMDVDVVQDEQLNKAIAESLAMSTTVDEVDEVFPPEALIRKDNRQVTLGTHAVSLV
jgi:D-alanyl-D-alanine dipeptidase